MGLLDQIQQYLQQAAEARGGGMPFDATPADRAAAVPAPQQGMLSALMGAQQPQSQNTANLIAPPGGKPQEMDFSQGFPVPYTRAEQKVTEGGAARGAMDADLAKFREKNPVPTTPPEPMAAQSPLVGLLGANAQGGMPAGVGQPPAPGSAAPPQPAPGGSGAAPAPPLPGLTPSLQPGGAAPPLPAPQNIGPAPGMPPAAPPAPAGPVPGQPPAPGGITDMSARSASAPGGIPGALPGTEPQGDQPHQFTGILGGIQKALAGYDKFTQKNAGTLLALGAGLAGAPSIGAGMSRGFSNVASVLPQQQQQYLAQQQQLSTYNALVSSGMPKQQALAAAQNPDLLKQLGPEYLTTRKSEVKTIKDSLGNERLVAVNPYMSQEELDKVNNEGVSGGAGAGQLGHMPTQIDPKTGRDESFLEAFRKADPVNAAATEAILNGNVAGSGRNLQQLQKYAARIDPNFNAATFAARQKLYSDYYGGGEGFKQVRAANTAIDHGVQLGDAIKRLNNFTTLPGFINPVTRTVSEQFSGKYQAALKDFEAAKNVFAHELEFSLTGKNTVSGSHEFSSLFDKDASPEANMSALQSGLEKLGERIHEHEASYNRGMGGKATTNPVSDMVTNLPKLNEMISRGAGGAPQGAGSGASGSAASTPAPVTPVATAVNPKTGERVVYRDGKWQPLN